MSEEEVVQFLRSQPQFFDRHPELLESILVPHPHGGRAIPLTERQILGLREKVRLLEGRLGELIRHAEDNDAIAEKVHRLSVALLAARDFPTGVQTLYLHLREDFSVPHVALRAWSKGLPEGAREGQPVDAELRDRVENLSGPTCGPAAQSPFLAWFAENQDHVRSLALVPLGQTRAFGLLAMGSEDPKRFNSDMGTLFLRRIGELAAATVMAHR